MVWFCGCFDLVSGCVCVSVFCWVFVVLIVLVCGFSVEVFWVLILCDYCVYCSVAVWLAVDC